MPATIEVSVARGDLVAAERELSHALDQMKTYPVPIVAWKTYALRGRLRAQSGDSAGAREAYAHAGVNIKKIADGVHDEVLRTAFVNSFPVREVFEGVSFE